MVYYIRWKNLHQLIPTQIHQWRLLNKIYCHLLPSLINIYWTLTILNFRIIHPLLILIIHYLLFQEKSKTLLFESDEKWMPPFWTTHTITIVDDKGLIIIYLFKLICFLYLSFIVNNYQFFFLHGLDTVSDTQHLAKISN